MSSAAEIAESLVREGVAQEVAAGCAIAEGDRYRVEAGGNLQTFFDLASLTKPMTAVALARSGLPLSSTLGEAIPTLADSPSGKVSLTLLLSHRAGLAAHAALYLPLLAGERVDLEEALRCAADARREECPGVPPPAGFPPVYSDLGYVLAGAALARRLGVRDAGDAIAELVVAPLDAAHMLGTARSLEKAGVDLVARAAPTEDLAWRGGIIRGRVHDENAWALTGEGGSGHAGMFGSVSAVLAFGCAVMGGLAGRGPFADAHLRDLVQERPGGSLRAGFDGKSESGSSAGASFGPRAFGHLGFTGTSLWIDPDSGVVVVLLTNRVHPSREHTAIREARPRAHEALFQRALELGARE